MNGNDGRQESRKSGVTSIDALHRRRGEDGRLVREALERSTDGADAPIEGLLAAVPRMLEEAERRRQQASRRDALTASIPMARVAIPRLAAVAAVLVAISAALLLTGGETATSPATSFDDVVVAGNTISDEMIVESILGPERQP